jgi:hypothetical protein
MKSAYVLTIFLSAFLLFQVELILGRELLPWFGGAPALWTTCLVFFQVVLLSGYAYAHGIVGRLPLKAQAALHTVLVAVSVVLLAILAVRWPAAITPGSSWKPAPGADPVGQIILLLTVSVGVPFFVLSTTGPLLQQWSVISLPGGSPYRLYALSNAGSLAGLLGYPFIVEPFLGIRGQAYVWSLLYAVFALGVIVSALGMRRRSGDHSALIDSARAARNPSAGARILWMGLAGVASALLLSSTNHMCQDTAVIPLLWVLPLSLYLVTFILCFRYEGMYRRWLFPPLFCASLAYCVMTMHEGLGAPLLAQIAADSAVLLTGCIVCHGELVRARPGVAHLTGFYLAVAAGGALGGVAVAIVAPRIFNGFWEFQASLWGTAAVFFAALVRDRGAFLHRKPLLIRSLIALVLTGLAWVLIRQAGEADVNTRYVTRNFYGILRVVDEPEVHYLKLVHGRITHGFQFTDSARAGIPTSYYSRESGVGLAIENHPGRETGLRIGVVGMGVGTLAAYAREKDTIRFYEINPAVPRLSRGNEPFFTYLEKCRGRVEVVMGDARLSLERESEGGGNQRFDILALDAFSSDAIPVHLLTEEAFVVYLRHLRGPESILAVHISNRYLDLIPVVHGYALRHGLASAIVSSGEDEEGAWTSDWILVAATLAPLVRGPVGRAVTPWDSTAYREIRPWTDDYSNLLSVIRTVPGDP